MQLNNKLNIEDLRNDKLFDNGFRFKSFINLEIEEKRKILEIRNNIEIRKVMENCEIIKYRDHVNFIENLKTKNNNFYWAVKQNDDLIGAINLVEVDFEAKTGSFGIYIKPNLIGSGVGSIVIYNLLLLVFDSLNFSILYGKVKTDNNRSLGTLLSFGFIKKEQINDFINIELQRSKWCQKKISIKKKIQILNKIRGVNNEKN